MFKKLIELTLTKYYLEHKNERDKIGERGAYEEHTYGESKGNAPRHWVI